MSYSNEPKQEPGAAVDQVPPSVLPQYAALFVEIADFLRKSGLSESYFGRVACGNSEFMRRLRSGRDFQGGTVLKVRQFIAGYDGRRGGA